LEAFAAGFVILMMSNALIGPLFDPNQQGGDSHPLLRQIWLPIYVLILGMAAWRFPALKRFWLPAVLFLILVGWAFASTTWSIMPDMTFRRAVAVLITTIFGVYLAASFSGRGMSEIIAGCFLILAIGSYIVCLAYPTMGVHHDVNAGLWRGLWYEKNQMGALMVYGALASLSAAMLSPPRRRLWIVTLVLCVGLGLMTRSATTLICLILVLGGTAGLSLMGKGPAAAVASVWAGVTALLALAGVYYLAPQVLLGAVGKDATFTGRTEIWTSILRDSAQQPLTGYGYAAFWARESAPANWMRAQLQWNVPHAHNSWFDLLIQLGQIGLAIFSVIFGLAVVAAIFRHRQVNDGYFAALFLVVYAMATQSESLFLTQNGLPWVLAVAAICRLLGPTPAPPAPRPLMAQPARRPDPTLIAARV
jgi:exopolysaccharide production protein ExoQ